MFRRIKAYKCLRWEESIIKVIRNYAERHEYEDQLKLCDDALYSIHSEMKGTWFNRVLTFIYDLKCFKGRL